MWVLEDLLNVPRSLMALASEASKAPQTGARPDRDTPRTGGTPLGGGRLPERSGMAPSPGQRAPETEDDF